MTVVILTRILLAAVFGTACGGWNVMPPFGAPDHQPVHAPERGSVAALPQPAAPPAPPSPPQTVLPTALDAEHQKLLDDLKAKNGKDFDQSYDQAQLKGHRDAVALFEAYAKGGDDAELKGWAGQTLPISRSI